MLALRRPAADRRREASSIPVRRKTRCDDLDARHDRELEAVLRGGGVPADHEPEAGRVHERAAPRRSSTRRPAPPARTAGELAARRSCAVSRSSSPIGRTQAASPSRRGLAAERTRVARTWRRWSRGSLARMRQSNPRGRRAHGSTFGHARCPESLPIAVMHRRWRNSALAPQRAAQAARHLAPSVSGGSGRTSG